MYFFPTVQTDVARPFVASLGNVEVAPVALEAVHVVLNALVVEPQQLHVHLQHVVGEQTHHVGVEQQVGRGVAQLGV